LVRFVNMLVFSLVASLGLASGARALTTKSALRANFAAPCERIGDFGSQGCEMRRETQARLRRSASGAPDNMRGRMYDPLIGRFITPDPIVQSPGNSQSWNRYSYVMNSPLNFVDPSGFEMVQTCGPGMGACEPGVDMGFADDGKPEPSSGGAADGPTAAETGQMINNAERGLLQMPPSMDPGRAGNESWWNNIQIGNPSGVPTRLTASSPVAA